MGFREGSTTVLLAEKIIKGIQKMTVKEVLDLMNSYSGLTTIAVVVLASLLEVSKIKINPWSWVGGRLNKNIMCKVDKIERDLADVERKVGENTAVSSRYRILRFDDELLHEVKHTKEHFDQILYDIDVYERYCNEHPDFKNNLAVMAIKHIKNVYQKCSRDNLFL